MIALINGLVSNGYHISRYTAHNCRQVERCRYCFRFDLSVVLSGQVGPPESTLTLIRDNYNLDLGVGAIILVTENQHQHFEQVLMMVLT